MCSFLFVFAKRTMALSIRIDVYILKSQIVGIDSFVLCHKMVIIAEHSAYDFINCLYREESNVFKSWCCCFRVIIE